MQWRANERGVYTQKCLISIRLDERIESYELKLVCMLTMCEDLAKTWGKSNSIAVVKYSKVNKITKLCVRMSNRAIPLCIWTWCLPLLSRLFGQRLVEIFARFSCVCVCCVFAIETISIDWIITPSMANKCLMTTDNKSAIKIHKRILNFLKYGSRMGSWWCISQTSGKWI